MNNIKFRKLLPFIISLFFGLVTFAFLAINFFTSATLNACYSGYCLLGAYGNGFVQMLIAIFTLIFLLLGVLLIVIGIFGMMRVFGILKYDAVRLKYDLDEIFGLVFMFYSAVSLALFLFGLIEVATNANLQIGVGLVLNPLVIVFSYILYAMLIEPKFVIGIDFDETKNATPVHIKYKDNKSTEYKKQTKPEEFTDQQSTETKNEPDDNDDKSE